MMCPNIYLEAWHPSTDCASQYARWYCTTASPVPCGQQHHVLIISQRKRKGCKYFVLKAIIAHHPLPYPRWLHAPPLKVSMEGREIVSDMGSNTVTISLAKTFTPYVCAALTTPPGCYLGRR